MTVTPHPSVQEDIDSFLKFGKVKHGEWYLEGERLPGGDHSQPLAEGFRERAVQAPDFPDYQRKLSLTDQCAAQFDGKDNYHQTAEWLTKFGILRVHWTLESMHGKNICDALSNLPSNAITEAIRNPVGRFHILRLSQPRPRSRKGAGDPGCRRVVQGELVGDRAHL